MWSVGSHIHKRVVSLVVRVAHFIKLGKLWKSRYFTQMADSLDQLIMVEIWTYLSFFFWYRRISKWLLHYATGCCELQRICNKIQHGAVRTKAIEESLRHSRTKALSELPDKLDVKIDEAVSLLMTNKKIDVGQEKLFYDAISACLTQICGYTELFKIVEEERQVKYSSDNEDHENKLMELWSIMMPNTKLEERITKQWGEIGFQGRDPMTDFRGMGILGLNNLLYFASKHTPAARKVLSSSHHPHYGFSYAIVGINITGMAYRLLKTGALRTHFYNCKQQKPTMDGFNEVFCYLFFEFNSFWVNEKPESVMEFNRVKDKFEEKVTKMLSTDINLQLTLKYRDINDSTSLSSVTSLDTHF